MPKTYVCPLCQKENSRRKSYACADGRACKTHSGSKMAMYNSEPRVIARETRIIADGVRKFLTMIPYAKFIDYINDRLPI